MSGAHVRHISGPAKYLSDPAGREDVRHHQASEQRNNGVIEIHNVGSILRA